MNQIEFKYKAIPVLEDFHRHSATYKWIYGGVGGSKSHTIIAHIILHSQWYPGSFILIGRKVEHTMKSTIQRETVAILKGHNMIAEARKTDGEYVLKNGSELKFMPMNLPVTEYGSINASLIVLDEASEIKEYIIKYMTTRLRRRFDNEKREIKRELILASTWEGRNHLWKIWIRDNHDNPKFEKWKVKTADNPYLPPDYEQNLRDIQDKEWCDRYLDCLETSFAGLVFPGFDPDIHVKADFVTEDFDIEACDKRLIVDCSPHHSAVLVQYLDAKNNILYNVDAWKKPYPAIREIGRAIELRMDRYNVRRSDCKIDPANASRELTSRSSVRRELKKYLGFNLGYAKKNKRVSIEIIKSRLEVVGPADSDMTDNGPIKYKGGSGTRVKGLNGLPTVIYLKGRYGNTQDLIEEMMEYIWVDSTFEEFEMKRKEEPKKQKDDLIDCQFYGALDLDKKAFLKASRLGNYDPRLELPYYKELMRKEGIRPEQLNDMLEAKYVNKRVDDINNNKTTDGLLDMAIQQGYVPKGCKLKGEIVMGLIRSGQYPCRDCNSDRSQCQGTLKPVKKPDINP